MPSSRPSFASNERDETHAIASALRDRVVIPDELFDRLYPTGQRFRSFCHWTPIDVAIRAAELLAPTPHQRVLDVGAGVGKLCLVGALTTGAHWYGIERDLDMVGAALRAARRLGVQDRVHLMVGDAAILDWSQFDAFYLFNPFAEGLYSLHEDERARRIAYDANIDLVEHQLATAGPGTRVVTYHGFGGSLPSGFELVGRERARDDQLCLWVRR